MHNRTPHNHEWPPKRGERLEEFRDGLTISYVEFRNLFIAGTERLREFAHKHTWKILGGAAVAGTAITVNTIYDSGDIENYPRNPDIIYQGYLGEPVSEIAQNLCPHEDPRDVTIWLDAYNGNINGGRIDNPDNTDIITPVCD